MTSPSQNASLWEDARLDHLARLCDALFDAIEEAYEALQDGDAMADRLTLSANRRIEHSTPGGRPNA